MVELPNEVLQGLIAYLPQVDLTVLAKILSNRRNKGLLAMGETSVCRKLNLDFFNSGVNDGLSSSVVRECVLLRGLLSSHPHIVPVSRIACPSLKEVRITYPRMSCSLREYIDAHGSSGLGEKTRDLFQQLSRALAFVHSQNIAHRNVRPENILLEENDGFPILKLTDFGLAKRGGDGRSPETPSETRNRTQTDKERRRILYRPPERLLRLTVSNSSIGAGDMWAAGVVLAEMLTGRCPWEKATSVSELIVRIFKLVGSPHGLEDGCLQWWPEFDVPDFAKIAATPAFLLSENDGFWVNVKTGLGTHAMLLLAKLLASNPRDRLTSDGALHSPFLLGRKETKSESIEALAWFGQDIFHRPQSLRMNVAVACGGLVPNRLKTIAWLFKVSRILECSSSRPVHTAVSIFTSLGVTDDVFPTLAACLKIAQRFFVSKDMFKQISCSEIVSACDGAISDESIIRAEQMILLRVDEITACFDTSLVDHIDAILGPGLASNRQLRYVSEYIADLCLFDDRLADIATVAQACVVLASQWLGLDPSPYCGQEVSVDALSITLGQCACVLTEGRAEVVQLENGLIAKIIEFSYRLPDGSSAIPRTAPTNIRTNRGYVESLIGTQRKYSLPPNTPLRQTPPKPLLLRLSTIQHAKDWAVESRKRSRSSTPLPGARAKRMCVTPTKFSSENTAPTNTPRGTPTNSIKSLGTPKRRIKALDESGMTPRRSARLASRPDSIIKP